MTAQILSKKSSYIYKSFSPSLYIKFIKLPKNLIISATFSSYFHLLSSYFLEFWKIVFAFRALSLLGFVTHASFWNLSFWPTQCCQQWNENACNEHKLQHVQFFWKRVTRSSWHIWNDNKSLWLKKITSIFTHAQIKNLAASGAKIVDSFQTRSSSIVIYIFMVCTCFF